MTAARSEMSEATNGVRAVVGVDDWSWMVDEDPAFYLEERDGA